VKEHADALGLRLDLTRATSSAITQVTETANSMMERLRGAVSDADIEECRENIYGMVRMIELLEGPDKPDVLRLECNRMISGRTAVA